MSVHFSKEYIETLDKNIKLLAREIRKRLELEYDVVIGITGYPGYGKSTLAILLSALVDKRYDLSKNICFIPTSNQIEKTYKSLPQRSVMHIDEASRGLHKHKWQDRVQQKLNELFDTERENHYLCTLLLMPRFQNFAENFRNFRINIWVNIVERGIAIVYKRDEDKDCKDPWHIDENYKDKTKKLWKKQKVYERSVSDIVTVESKTSNYWFYFQFPDIPSEISQEYRNLKADSRIIVDDEVLAETYQEQVARRRVMRWNEIIKMRNEGFNNSQIAVKMQVTIQTIKNNLKEIKASQMMGGVYSGVDKLDGTHINKNNKKKVNFWKIQGQGNKEQKDIPKEESWETSGLINES